MKFLLDATGAIQSWGDADLAAPEGGSVVEADLPIDAPAEADAAATGPHDLVLDTTGATPQIVARPRAENADEQARDDRTSLLAQIDAAITGWPSATSAQKLDAVLLCLKAIRAIARYVLRGAA